MDCGVLRGIMKEVNEEAYGKSDLSVCLFFLRAARRTGAAQAKCRNFSAKVIAAYSPAAIAHKIKIDRITRSS